MEEIFPADEYMKLLHNKEFEKAVSYRARFTPNYLYKYYSLIEDIDPKAKEKNNQKFSTLENNQIWLSISSCQNDPYEFKGMYFNREKLREIGFKDNVLDYLEDIAERIPFTCFTDNASDNMPMWAHYANNHKGFCVKYRVLNKRAFRNVIYESARMPIANILARLFVGDDEEDKRFNGLLLFENFFIKHKSWRYEKEYRYVHPDEIEGKGVYANITEIGLEISEIICGYNCSDENIKELERISTVLGVPCKKCQLSDNEYSVLEEV